MDSLPASRVPTRQGGTPQSQAHASQACAGKCLPPSRLRRQPPGTGTGPCVALGASPAWGGPARARMKHPSSARDLRRSTALGPLRTFGSVLAPACLHRRGIRPLGCPAPLMSHGLGLWPTPPPLLRCARHPSGLIRQQWLFSTAESHPCGLPRAWGGRCSEVEAETAAARPSSGDMSVSGLPAPAARTDASTRAAARHSFVNVRNRPRAVDRRRS